MGKLINEPFDPANPYGLVLCGDGSGEYEFAMKDTVCMYARGRVKADKSNLQEELERVTRELEAARARAFVTVTPEGD
jgi:hypothetical protein